MQGAMQGLYGWRAQGLSLTRQVGSRQTARPSEQVPLGTLEWGRSRSVSGRYSVCLSVSRSVRGAGRGTCDRDQSYHPGAPVPQGQELTVCGNAEASRKCCFKNLCYTG